MAIILIVDDEPNVRTLLSIAFGDQYTVLEAADGWEGFQLFEQHHPDLIITDSNMPVMSGTEMVKRIRASGSQVKIIACSTFRTPQAQERIVTAGVDLCLKKPADLTTLETAIAKLLETS